jgi:hypothetical protein
VLRPLEDRLTPKGVPAARNLVASDVPSSYGLTPSDQPSLTAALAIAEGRFRQAL